LDMLSKSSLILLAYASVSAALKASYEDHKVVRCSAENRQQLDVLHNLENNADLQLDFWQEARRLGTPVDIMVSNKYLAGLEKVLSDNNIKCSTMIENVEATATSSSSKKVQNLKGSSYFEDYHNSTEVHAYFDQLASEFSNLAKVSTIGTTYTGKPMQIITMSTAPGTKKPALWFDGGLHAREWITVATVTYVADALLRGYGKDSDATSLLDTYDVIICPILNVDGYDYTWAEDGDRMWRKTRSPNGNNRCVGTDPNRNWEFHWGEAGTSEQKCSDSYEGASAASEVEVQHIQNYLFDHKDTLKAYVNFHSYSQEWMSPWGYTDAYPADYATQNALSAAATTAIKNTHGKEYIYGPIATTIYPASGSSADYAYGVCGIVYSYGVELRDTGAFGFLLPPEEIVPSGQEIYAAIVAMGNYIKAEL